MTSSEVVSEFLSVEVHASYFGISLVLYNDQCSPKSSLLLEHVNGVIKNFQISVDACVFYLDNEYGPLNLCDEGHDISLVHSFHMCAEIMSNALDNFEWHSPLFDAYLSLVLYDACNKCFVIITKDCWLYSKIIPPWCVHIIMVLMPTLLL